MTPCARWLPLVLAALCGSDVQAQPMTLGQALALAGAQHPLLRAGEAQVEAAAAAVITAGAYPNPEAAVLIGRQTGPTPGGRVPLYEIRQPLELGAVRPARLALARQGREATEQLLGEVRLAVLSQVRRTFYQVLRRVEEARLADENLRLVEDLRDRVRVRVDVGEIGRIELVRAEAEVAAARTLASGTAIQRVAALAQFRAAIGGSLPADIELDGQLDQPASLPPLDELRRQARERHPQLRRAAAEVRRLEARVAHERALRQPQPTLWSEIDQANPSYRVGVSVPVPLWNRRRGPIAEAAAGLKQSIAEAEARELAIIAALDGAYERYAVANQQAAMFEQGLLREAEEALRAAEVAYQLGERGILDVLDAQRVLRTVRLNFLNVRHDRQAALVDLDELRGVDLRAGTP